MLEKTNWLTGELNFCPVALLEAKSEKHLSPGCILKQKCNAFFCFLFAAIVFYFFFLIWPILPQSSSSWNAKFAARALKNSTFFPFFYSEQCHSHHPFCGAGSGGAGPTGGAQLRLRSGRRRSALLDQAVQEQRRVLPIWFGPFLPSQFFVVTSNLTFFFLLLIFSSGREPADTVVHFGRRLCQCKCLLVCWLFLVSVCVNWHSLTWEWLD